MTATAADLAPGADATGVPILGAVRRIQSLIAAGHTHIYLRRRLGVSRATMRQLTGRPARGGDTGPCITAALHQRVHALWDELQVRPGRSATARRIGAKWPVPFMWDEDRIDDPVAEPVDCRRDNKRGAKDKSDETKAQRDARRREVVAATLRGETTRQIADRLAVTNRTVIRDRAHARREGLLDPGELSEAS